MEKSGIGRWLQLQQYRIELFFEFYMKEADWLDWSYLIFRIALSILIAWFIVGYLPPRMPRIRDWVRDVLNWNRHLHRPITIGLIVALLLICIWLLFSCLVMARECVSMEAKIEHLNNFNQQLIDELNG